jgi:hypothetical protein
MALLRDYELPGTGVTIQNAYHVVTDIKVEKRIADVQMPPDVNHPTGLTNGGVRTEGSDVYWKAGYTAQIGVTIWKDKAARDNDAKPVGFIGTNPSDNKYGVSIGTSGMDHKCVFFIDQSSTLDHMAQAYQHLLTTDYYSGSQQI